MSRAPRVLVSGVVLAQPEGGVRRHNAELLPRLARRLERGGGHLAVLTGPDELPFALPDSVEVLPSAVPAGPPMARARHEGRALRDALERARAADRPFDLVHTAHHPVPRSIVRETPFTLTVHDLRSLDFAGAPTVRRFLGKTVLGGSIRRARRVFAVSRWVASRLHAHFELDEARVGLVPNGCDHLPVLERRPGPDAPLLHVGHLEPRKNLGLLVEALALDATLPDLWLVGAPKAGAREELEAKASRLGVRERVRFLGTVGDGELSEVYARAACVVIPSWLEGFGISAVEALRAGVPLAVSDAGALPEVTGGRAALFDPTDATACARAIRSALESGRTSDSTASLPTWDEAASAWYAGLCTAAESARS